MDATAKKLWGLVSADRPLEVRRAALVVLGELDVADVKLPPLLAEAMNDPDPEVRAQALATAGKLKIEQTLPQLVARIQQGGAEAEAAAQAAARLGPSGISGLKKLMAEVSPGLRRRIASALGSGDSPTAEKAALDVLLDSDPNVVDAAGRSLLAQVPSFDTGHRRRLAGQALAHLKPRRGELLPLASEIALVRLLAGLEARQGEPAFWDRLDASRPHELRAVALQALGALPPPADRDKLRRLIGCATDSDFRIAAPALLILQAATINERHLADWEPLFTAADPAVRKFAVEKLGDKDLGKVVLGLCAQLDHPDRSLADRALSRLADLRKGQEALGERLLDAPSPDAAWNLARAQSRFIAAYPKALRAKLLARACEWLEEGDRRADAVLFLLREAAGPELRDSLEKRAAALRQKKRYASAIVYLRLLCRDPACAASIRFDLAACTLKVSEHDLAADARAKEPALAQFAELLRRHALDVAEAVEKARWLEAEDLFYLGFHFSEASGEEKEFGGKMLQLLLRRFPRSKLARDAKNKLRRQGIK